MTQNDILVLNPNTADDEELRQLPGVGPQLAGRIVDGRPYQSAEDLRQVPGLGESVLEDIKPFLTFEAQASDHAEDRESEEMDKTASEPSRIRLQSKRRSIPWFSRSPDLIEQAFGLCWPWVPQACSAL